MSTPNRRQFLQAAVAASAVGATVPRWTMAAGAAPLAADEGMIVLVNLTGGCDSLEVLVPSMGPRRSAYEAARGGIAIGADKLLAATQDHGFSPHLPKLAARYAAGDVAVIDGVGMANNSRSHFESTKVVQSANTTPTATGWLGRHLDGHVERGDELMSVAVAPVVPLHLRGAVNDCAAMSPGLGLWGGDTRYRAERSTYDAVRAFADTPLARGPWADDIAASGAYALNKAALTGTVASPTRKQGDLIRDMELAAHVLNADIGTRAVAVETTGYDTHAGQRNVLSARLKQLDAAIETFFTTLAPERHGRVMVLVVSEFGRKAPVNASLGTDHGHAGLAMAIGANVAGGVYGEHPSIEALDPFSSMVPTIDLREVYATVLDRWMAGDSAGVLGRQYPTLDLIAAPAGSTA